jgi:hypothetical protein
VPPSWFCSGIASPSGNRRGLKTFPATDMRNTPREPLPTGSESGVYEDFRDVEADLRNQYRLIYRPAELKHNGAFHRIELKAPERVDNIKIRSGYYAPAR